MTLKVSGAELETFARRAGKGAHAEGTDTQATASYAHAEGNACIASGACAHAEGEQSAASGSHSHAEGYISTASGSYSHAGGYYGRADAVGAWARGSATGALANRAQVAIYTLGAYTTGTATTLNFDGNVAALTVPTYATYLFELSLTAKRQGTATSSQGWCYKGVIARDSGSVRIVGTVTQVSAWSETNTNGTVSVTANTTNNTLQVSVTPSSSSTTSWFGTLIVTELQTSS